MGFIWPRVILRDKRSIRPDQTRDNPESPWKFFFGAQHGKKPQVTKSQRNRTKSGGEATAGPRDTRPDCLASIRGKHNTGSLCRSPLGPKDSRMDTHPVLSVQSPRGLCSRSHPESVHQTKRLPPHRNSAFEKRRSFSACGARMHTHGEAPAATTLLLCAGWMPACFMIFVGPRHFHFWRLQPGTGWHPLTRADCDIFWHFEPVVKHSHCEKLNYINLELNIWC